LQLKARNILKPDWREGNASFQRHRFPASDVVGLRQAGLCKIDGLLAKSMSARCYVWQVAQALCSSACHFTDRPKPAAIMWHLFIEHTNSSTNKNTDLLSL